MLESALESPCHISGGLTSTWLIWSQTLPVWAGQVCGQTNFASYGLLVVLWYKGHSFFCGNVMNQILACSGHILFYVKTLMHEVLLKKENLLAHCMVGGTLFY